MWKSFEALVGRLLPSDLLADRLAEKVAILATGSLADNMLKQIQGSAESSSMSTT